jgi:peptidoglycan hydrolase FlgJ
MINSHNISGKLAIDTKSVDDLRLQAKQNPEQALKEVAQQFEAIFINMMLKSMREALPKKGIFDSQETQFYTQMLDQQLAQKMSTSGIGLADMMVQQLSRANGQQMQPDLTNVAPEERHAALNQSSSGLAGDISSLLWPAGKTTQQALLQPEQIISSYEEMLIKPLIPSNPISPASNQPENFVSAVWSHAKAASQATGIPAHFMIAQAALESGWGKHEIRHADNRPSFNLFGIKAGESWKGAVVETVTTEYINGIPEKMVEKFRAYNSYAEGFQDYANLLLNNPRYATVLKNQDATAFAQGLQQAGYATDPMYADKLIRIINSNSIRQQPMI